MTWLQSFLNEPHTQEGSSQRLCLFLLVVTILALVAFLTITGHKLPEVPATLENLVEYLGSALVLGIGFGKGTTAWKAVKGIGPLGQISPTDPSGASPEVQS